MDRWDSLVLHGTIHSSSVLFFVLQKRHSGRSYLKHPSCFARVYSCCFVILTNKLFYWLLEVLVVFCRCYSSVFPYQGANNKMII